MVHERVLVKVVAEGSHRDGVDVDERHENGVLQKHVGPELLQMDADESAYEGGSRVRVNAYLPAVLEN